MLVCFSLRIIILLLRFIEQIVFGNKFIVTPTHTHTKHRQLNQAAQALLSPVLNISKVSTSSFAQYLTTFMVTNKRKTFFLTRNQNFPCCSCPVTECFQEEAICFLHTFPSGAWAGRRISPSPFSSRGWTTGLSQHLLCYMLLPLSCFGGHQPLCCTGEPKPRPSTPDEVSPPRPLATLLSAQLWLPLLASRTCCCSRSCSSTFIFKQTFES